MLRYIKLQKIFICQYFKELMEYKVDFIIGIVSTLMTQALNILFLYVIFANIPSLYGWTFSEIVFIYGYSLIPKGIDHLFSDNLWMLAKRIIKKGEFDRYLLRPISPLFQVLVEVFQLDAIGELLIGILFIVKTGHIVNWTGLKIILFLISIPFATLIYTSIKLIGASIAFWTKQSGSILYILYMLNNFAKYPIKIYNFLISFIISYMIPFAFTAFYPANYLIRGGSWLIFLELIFVSLGLASFAYFIWNKGIKKYEGSGT